MIDLDGLHSHTWGADACSGTRFISVNSTGKWSWLLPRRFYMYCFTRPPEGSLSLQTGVSTRRLTWGGAWDLGWATSTSNSHSMDKVTELQHQRDQQNLALAPQLRP